MNENKIQIVSSEYVYAMLKVRRRQGASYNVDAETKHLRNEYSQNLSRDL